MLPFEEYIKELSQDELKMLMSIINHLGTGHHPAADMTTLKYFSVEYVSRLLNDAEGKLSELGEPLRKSLKEKLTKYGDQS